MSRRSPRSYISRTFPEAMRGRSETGGMGRRLSGLEDDDRDGPVGVALVLRVVAVTRHQPRPVPVALGLARLAGTNAAPLAAGHLDLGLRGRQEVVEPRRVLVSPALGGDDDQPLAVGQVEHGRDARLAALAADVVQQEDGQPLQAPAETALAGPVHGDVDPGADVDQLPERGGVRRAHEAGLYGSAPGMGRLDRSALRDTWQAVLATRALVWVVALTAVLRFGLEPTVSPPAEVHPYGWLPTLLTAPATPWDAGHYVGLALHGYDQPLRAAFFPLYPLLARALTAPLDSPIAGALAISLAAFAAALYLLHRLVALEAGERYARAALWVVALFPTAFFYSAIYTESL